MDCGNYEDLCRICLSRVQEDDECLFHYVEDIEMPQLSALGRLYEDLFGLYIPFVQYHPNFLCSSCILQLKLFQKLKNKAIQAKDQFIKAVSEVDSKSKLSTNQEDIDTNLLFEPEEDESQKYECYESEEQYVENSCDENEDIKEEDTKDNLSEIETIEDATPIVSLNLLEEETHSNYEDDELETESITYLEDEYENIDDPPVSTMSIEIEKAQIDQVIDDEYYDQKTDDESELNSELLEMLDDEEFDITVNKSDVEANVHITAKKKTKVKETSNAESAAANRVYTCNMCSEVFDHRDLLKNHKTDQHIRKKLTCSYCSKKVYSEEALQVHYNIHNGLPAYKCEECNKPFNQKIHYQYHMLSHANQRDVKCEICQKGFLSKGDLNVHMRVHNDERRYVCDICDKTFRAYSHMTNHRFSHFNMKFECEYCNQKYSSPNTLRTHIRTIHMGDANFQCEYCDKKFKRKHHLSAHMKIHENVIQHFSINEM